MPLLAPVTSAVLPFELTAGTLPRRTRDPRGGCGDRVQLAGLGRRGDSQPRGLGPRDRKLPSDHVDGHARGPAASRDLPGELALQALRVEPSLAGHGRVRALEPAVEAEHSEDERCPGYQVSTESRPE